MRTSSSSLAVCCTIAAVLCLVPFPGCETGSAEGDLDGTYLQAPLGYVAPYEMQDQVPIQIGPQPVPLIGGSPSIYLPEHSPVIEMTAHENGFQPAEIVAAPGQVVTVRLTNRSSVNRNLRVELPDAGASVPQDLAPGESRIIVFTAPMQPGSYMFHSSGNDPNTRLEGRLLVRESP